MQDAGASAGGQTALGSMSGTAGGLTGVPLGCCRLEAGENEEVRLQERRCQKLKVMAQMESVGKAATSSSASTGCTYSCDPAPRRALDCCMSKRMRYSRAGSAEALQSMAPRLGQHGLQIFQGPRHGQSVRKPALPSCCACHGAYAAGQPLRHGKGECAGRTQL